MNESTDRCLPGERRPGESAKAFQAVRLYLETGPNRSQRAVATQLSTQPSQIQKWAKKWDWRERAHGHDEHLASEAQLVMVKLAREKAALWASRKEEHRENKFQTSQKLFARGEQICFFPLITSTIKDGTTVIHPAKWNLRDGLHFTNTALKMCDQAIEEEDEESLLRDETFIIEDYRP